MKFGHMCLLVMLLCGTVASGQIFEPLRVAARLEANSCRRRKRPMKPLGLTIAVLQPRTCNGAEASVSGIDSITSLPLASMTATEIVA